LPEGGIVERVGAGRAALRYIVVFAIALFASLNTLLDVTLPWQPFSDFGMRFDAVARVYEVDAGHNADRAGVRVGDRAVLAATPIWSRPYLSAVGYYSAPTGRRATFTFERDGKTRLVDLVAQVHTRTLAANATDLFQMSAFAAVIAIGATLLLLRPSRMMWAFFLFCAFANARAASVGQYLPAPAFVADLLLWLPAKSLANVALVVFALRFPNDDAPGWRARAQQLALWSLVAIVPIAVWSMLGEVLALPGSDLAVEVDGIVPVLALAFVVLVFALTYAHSPATDRAKIRWVFLGLVIGKFGILFIESTASIPGISIPWSLPVINMITSLIVAVPISVAYAVIRHRVFDVRFVAGRAVVYGVLTTTVVVFVALIDFVLGKALSQTHIAGFAEAVAAIVLGLSLNSLHKRIESVVERVFFRRRRLAEHRLARIAAGLIHAESAAAITEAILAEPVHAFALASAAVFRRDENGSFVLAGAINWDAPVASIQADVPAILALSADPDPFAVAEGLWPAGTLPKGEAVPAYALPIFVRRRVDGIAFYGAHSSAEQLDPDELAALTILVHSAGFAYEHLASEAALAQTAALRVENRTLRTLIAGGASPPPS
jgi:hypothetical protein